MTRWLKNLGHEDCGLALVCSGCGAPGNPETTLAHGTGAVAVRAEGFHAGEVVVSIPRAAMMTEEVMSTTRLRLSAQISLEMLEANHAAYFSSLLRPAVSPMTSICPKASGLSDSLVLLSLRCRLRSSDCKQV